MSRVLEIKSQRVKKDKRTLDSFVTYFSTEMPSRETNCFQIFSWGMELDSGTFFRKVGHVLFPQNIEGVEVGLLHFHEKIKWGDTFAPALLADALRALCMAKTTPSAYFESCVSLLQIWFLEP